MDYVLICKECGNKFNVVEDHKLEKWEYDFCRYTCFNKHMEPLLTNLAAIHEMTIDELREFYFDCGDLLIAEWYPLNRYNPDDPHEPQSDLLVRKRTWKKER